MGAYLKSDLESRLDVMRKNLSKIAELSSKVVENHRESLFKRLSASGLDLDISDERVIKEIGILQNDVILPRRSRGLKPLDLKNILITKGQ